MKIPKFKIEEMQNMWKEIIDIIPAIQEATIKGTERHKNQINPRSQHEIIERVFMQEIFDFFRRKWVLEIIQTLTTHKILFFNEIKKNLTKISSKTLSKRLSELEQEEIIERHVEQNAQPIRVWYDLTTFGKGLYQTIMPSFIYYFQHKHKKD